MIVNAKLMRYLAACMEANTASSAVEWTEVCPECGDVPRPYDADHLILEVGDATPGHDSPENIMAVVVACEGYYCVDPATLGLGDDHPGWMSPEESIGDTVECTCDEVAGFAGVHLPTCPAAVAGPVNPKS